MDGRRPSRFGGLATEPGVQTDSSVAHLLIPPGDLAHLGPRGSSIDGLRKAANDGRVNADRRLLSEFVVTMRVREWQIVDGTLDNTVNVEIVDGDPGIARLASAIRKAGWSQVAGWAPGQAESRGWPPEDQAVDVELSHIEWLLICGQLARWAAIGRDGGRSENAAMSEAIRELILRQLGHD